MTRNRTKVWDLNYVTVIMSATTKPFGNLVNDLLFTQLDHKIRVHPVNPAVNSRSGQRVQPPLPRSARYPS